MRSRNLLCLLLLLCTLPLIALGQERPANPSENPQSILSSGLGKRNRQSTEPENQPANVTSLSLENEILYSPCTSKSQPTCTRGEAQIGITTEAEDKENDVLAFKYKVSAGRITGKGATVTWDLSRVLPGKYSITASVDDGCGNCGKEMTKLVEVRLPVSLENVSLDKTRVCLVCPFFLKGKELEDERIKEMIVNVNTKPANVYPDLEYYYLVTGGQIIGDGPNVKWDLRSARPGTYKITVGIGKNNVLMGGTVERSVGTGVCGCCMIPCECGTLSIFGPTKAAKPGDTVIFRSEVSGGPDVTYKWTVSGGTIVTDPTGSSIMVKVPEDWDGQNIAATVELGGTNPACNCPRTASETVTIIK